MRAWERFCRWLGGLVLAGFAITALTPAANVLGRATAIPPSIGPAEAIVVLGGGLAPNGMLSGASLRRLVHGVVLLRQGRAPLLVLLGGSYGPRVSEAEIRAALVRELGIEPAVVLVEAAASTTREEANQTRAILVPRGIQRILLITDAHHMARASAVFQGVGFEVLPAPTDDGMTSLNEPEGRFNLVRRVVVEFAARLYYGLSP